MGRDKARATISGDTPLIRAVIAPLWEVFDDWTAVADRAGKYDDLGLRTIADNTPHRGPLAGILRAAEDTQQGYLFVTSCDRLGLKSRWVERLHERLSDNPPAVCFEFQGWREPLFGFYRADLAASMRRRLREGSTAVWRFLDAIDAAVVDAPAGWSETIRVNTPEQLDRARRRFR